MFSIVSLRIKVSSLSLRSPKKFSGIFLNLLLDKSNIFNVSKYIAFLKVKLSGNSFCTANVKLLIS